MNKQYMLAIALAASIGAGSTAEAAAKVAVGTSAPAMSIFRWVKGTPVTNFEPGKVYVVEFWATWCGPCKQSIPHLTELAKKYKGKATFTGVDVFETQTQKPGNTDVSYVAGVRKFVKEEGDQMDYNVAVDGPTGTMGRTWMEAAEQNGIPTAFVIGKDGKVAWIGHPMMGLDEVVGQVIEDKFDANAEAKKQADLTAKQNEMQAALMPLGKALQDKNFKDVVTQVDAILPKYPDLYAELTPLKFNALAETDPASAVAFAKAEAAGKGKSDANLLNSLAWSMIDPESKFKGMDYAVAESLAAQSLSLQKESDPMYPMTLDTLALAQFKNNKTADAVASETKAVGLAVALGAKMDPAALKDMKARLDQFKAAK